MVLLPQCRVRLHTEHIATQKQDRTQAHNSDLPPQFSRRNRWVSSKVPSQNALKDSNMHLDINYTECVYIGRDGNKKVECHDLKE